MLILQWVSTYIFLVQDVNLRLLDLELTELWHSLNLTESFLYLFSHIVSVFGLPRGLPQK